MVTLTKRWAPKLAGEAGDYRGVDWRTELETGEAIASYEFEFPEDSSVTLDEATLNGTKTIARLSGGTKGHTIEVMASIVTDATPPRELHVRILLPVV